MKRYRVIITDEALAQIEQQVTYIAGTGESPLNASHWLSRVLAAADKLEVMPRRYPLAPENTFRPLEIRALNVGGYLLLYTIRDDEKLVIVLSARHARQRPRRG